jgi:integration host factor subunit alpha
MLNKSDLIRGIAQEFDIPTKDVDRIIDRFLNLIGASLTIGEDVKLTGFGKFEAKVLKSQKRRNPRTGETFLAREKRSVAFTPSQLLRDRVDRSNVS